MDHLFDTRPDRPGYRLQRLEVFNWGTFDSSDGSVFRFEPEGRTSLLVGHNGSGKSTLVDAILTLLVDGQTRNYNVAAGAKKTERTPKSYIKGAFDRTADESQTSIVKFLRPHGNHLTALSAVFTDERLGKSFTLTQILFLKSDGSDDKFFAIADEPHELKQDLAGMQKSDEIREHLKQLGYRTTRTYAEYQSWFTKRTGMRGKAVEMFNQTVAVKDIQSLNAFIRRHMLEAHDWRDKVQRLLTHFHDLSVSHQELVRARHAEELLAPVEKIGGKYRRLAEQQQRLKQQLDACETFFPLLQVQLFTPELNRQRQRAADMATVIERLDRELRETRETVRQLKNEIDQAGGERLKQIPELIKTEEAHLSHKRTELQRYLTNLKVCGGADVVGDAEQFQQARRHLQGTLESAQAEITALQDQQAQALGQKARLEAELKDEREEWEFLKRRKTNLPSRFSAMRGRICADMNLDESALPFAAELISVLPEERRWEASAEMVLRSFALSLLVPERLYSRVRAYVEGHRMADARGEGQRLDYICVGRAAKPDGDRIDARSLINKLQFKSRHDLVPWVRAEITKRFNFQCCENLDEFNDVAGMALTENRHVKFNLQRHQKDDRPRSTDPRHFVLGWDNSEKIRRVAEHLRSLESDRDRLAQEIAALEQSINARRSASQAAVAALEITDFDAIDIKRHQEAILDLQTEKQQLEDSNDAVQALKTRLQKAEQAEEFQGSERDQLMHSSGELGKEIQQVSQMVAKAEAAVQTSRDAGVYESHAKWFDSLTESLGAPPLSIEDFSPRTTEWRRATNGRFNDANEPLRDQSGRLVKAMGKYLSDFKEETDDLDANVESLESFLGLLEQLRREDLPRYERKFKDRLNDQVSTEIGFFNTALKQEQRQIKDKIDQLNRALAEVEYNPGSYMRLDPQDVRDGEINDFRRSLQECLDGSFEFTDDANEARFLRIQALVERLSDKTRTTWRDKVIDVRNWYNFAAQEIERETGAIKSCYDGSSGQSGGEKAKLAFTILVAALAYQFDVDPTGQTPGRFQFVVVDEMFSKVDDQNAEYALKLFKQFGLQLLIVAPLDAKARVTEPFVDRYLHVVKDTTTNRSQLFSMTAREYDEVVKQFSGNGKRQATPRTTK